jgi:competence protein ComEC
MFLRPLIPALLSFAGGILVSHEALSEGYGVRVGLFFFTAALVFLFVLLPSPYRKRALIPLFLSAGMFLEMNARPVSGLADLAEHRLQVTVVGTVLQPSFHTDETARIMVKVEDLLKSGAEKGRGEKLVVTVFKPVAAFSPGQRILFPARLRPFRNFNNPGRYDYEKAMELGGFACAASVSDGRRILPMGKGDLGFPLEQLETFRKPVRELLKRRLPSDQAALFQALILGEKQAIGKELREPFNRAGLGHMLAVSGLHVALVAWFTFAVCAGALSLSYRLALVLDIRGAAAALTCLAVMAYACLTGFEVSCQRAMIMVLVFLFSIILGKEKERWSTLALAGLLVLAMEPTALFSISFQLSFSAVVGILWLGPPLQKALTSPVPGEGKRQRLLNRFYHYFADLTAVTLSATIFLLPLTSYYFHRFSLMVIPANLTALPVLGLLVLPTGLLAAAFLPLSTGLAEGLLKAAGWALERMMDYVAFWSSWSWSETWVMTPNVPEVLLLYAFMFFMFYGIHFPWARRGFVVVLLLLAGDVTYWVHRNFYNPHLKVFFLDVGQGSAALVQFPGKERMLIDGGGFSGDRLDTGKMVIAPFLLRSKITRIDYLVLSHPQTDHMDGLRFIASHFGPKEFWHNGERGETRAYEELMETLRSAKVPVFGPKGWKERRVIGGVAVAWLHPKNHDKERGLKLNDNSLVLKLSYQGKSFLFTGDLEKVGEDRVVLGEGSNLTSHVLLVPHHGSRTSCSSAFLDRVRPCVCIISVGAGNAFGFPSVEVLERLEGLGCEIFRTDRDGAVEVTVGPEGGVARPFLKGKVKGADRFGPFMF